MYALYGASSRKLNESKNLTMNNKCLIVVSRYKEDMSWLSDYENESLIYNKGIDDLKELNSIQVDNFGGNQYDICRYIYDNYHNLPNTIAFVQGNPYDHCAKEKFSKLINDNWFTALESYENLKVNSIHKKCKDIDFGYMEVNNSWYIRAHNNHLSKMGFEANCPYNNFDDFMKTFFEDYTHIDWLRFSPGSQYLVERDRCLRYPRSFWGNLMNVFPLNTSINGGTEAHIVERALWFIFCGFFKPKNTPVLVSSPPPPRFRDKFLLQWFAKK